MKWLSLVKKLVASVTGISSVNSSQNTSILDGNYILALNPLDFDAHSRGLIIVVMLIAIVVLIGYTLFSNRNK